jgi:hypothetical protein
MVHPLVMNVLPHLLSMLALAGMAAPAVAQEPEPAAETPVVDLFGGEAEAAPVPPAEPIDYGPGPEAFEVSAEEAFKRALLYNAASRYLLQRTLEVVLEKESARRAAEGRSIEGVVPTTEEIDAEVQQRRDEVLAQDPSVDFWAQVRAQGFTEATYRAELARNIQAQRMFFPLDPELWNTEQLAVVLGRNWTDYLEKDHQTLLEKKRETGEFQPLNDQILNQFLMPNVWNWLITQEEVRYPSDGLPEGVAMRIGDVDLMTDELLAVIEPIISETDRGLAREYMRNIALLQAELKAQGAWIDYSEFRRLFAEEAAMYEGTIIPHNMMVLDFLGFPTMEVYRQYFRAKKSFAATLPAKTLEDGSENPDFRALVDEQIATRGEFYRGSKVKVDVILLSARDKRTGQYPLGGDPYTSARERADEVADVLLGGEDFLETLVEYSDYPETTNTANANMPQPNRGRFPAQTRNDMRGFLGESDYTDFIFGYSLADDIFFYSEEGGIYGPVKSPLGWSFYRLNSRTNPAKQLNYGEDERDTFIVQDDLVTTGFLAFLAGLRAE